MEYPPMEAAKFHAWLKDAGGCADCRSWSKGLDLLTIWNTCERGGKAYWLKVKENRPETFAQRVALGTIEVVVKECM